MATIVTRAGKGSPLTHNEVDANFTNLNTAKAELASPALTGNVTVASNSATAAVTITQIGAGNALVVEDSASPDATPFVVTATGNVGIGTTAPAYTLEAAGVTKSIAATGTGNPQFLAITSDAAGIPFMTLQNATSSWQNRNNGTTGDLSWAVSGSERMRITLGGNLIVGNGDTSATPISSTLRTTNGSGTDIAGASLTVQGGRGTGTGAGGALLFSTAAAGTTGSTLNAAAERMRIDSVGNVGIGTTTPTASLDVLTQVTGALGISVRGRSSDNTSDISLKSNDATTVYGQIQGRSTDLRVQTGTALPITFYTTAAERMRIDASGFVGIGTGSPSALLQVDGGEIRQVQYGNNANYLTYTASGTQAAPTAISAATTLSLNSARAYDGSAYRDVTSIRSISDGAITSTSSPGYLTFRTTPSGTVVTVERMRITSDGNVGIGTTSPVTKLDVNGDITVRGAGSEGGQISLYNPDRTTTGLYIDVGSANTGRIFQVENNSVLTIGQLVGTGGIITFSTAAAERMRIDSTGAIGIGGANYGTSGQVLTSGGVGAAPSWADGINRGTAVASTSGTAIDFTGIPSWAKRITVLFHGVSINTSVDLLVQIGSTTFTTTGYSSASGQAQSGGTTTITSSTAGFHISDGNSSYLMSGSLVINMLGSNLINATGVFTGISTMVSTAGRVTITGAIDRVRVTSVGGAATFDAGTINVMWE